VVTLQLSGPPLYVGSWHITEVSGLCRLRLLSGGNLMRQDGADFIALVARVQIIR